MLKDSAFTRGLKLIFKILLFIFCLILFFIIGLFIGYVFLGGGNYWEVLNQETWQHIVNFIK